MWHEFYNIDQIQFKIFNISVLRTIVNAYFIQYAELTFIFIQYLFNINFSSKLFNKIALFMYLNF